MNQSHPKSQTTQVLYREPTSEELSPASNLFWNICSTLLLLIMVGIITLFMLRSCADEQAHIGEKYRVVNGVNK